MSLLDKLLESKNFQNSDMMELAIYFAHRHLVVLYTRKTLSTDANQLLFFDQKPPVV